VFRWSFPGSRELPWSDGRWPDRESAGGQSIIFGAVTVRVPGTPARRLVIDAGRCTACGCCELACSLRAFGECNPSRSLVSIIRGSGDAAATSTPVTCQQCEDALCVTLCPAEALTSRSADGVVVVDAGLCLGCRTCAEVCPQGAPFVDPRLRTSQKCTLCDGDPVCVRVCPEGALGFAPQEEEGAYRKRAALAVYLEELERVAMPARRGGGAS
jgi:Fe-S-cluster-containing dehydrogenase component